MLHPSRIRCLGLLLAIIATIASCNISGKLQSGIDKIRPSVDSLSRSAARNAATGFGDSANRITTRLIAGLKGISDTLDPDIKKTMAALRNIGSLSDSQLLRLGTTLQAQLIMLKKEVKDSSLARSLSKMIDQLGKSFDKNSRYLLSNMIAAALDSVNKDGSTRNLAHLLPIVLGDSARLAAQGFVLAALQPALDSLTNKTHDIIHDNIPFIRRQAGLLLGSLGAIALAIIGYIWYQRRKYARLLQIMTFHIDKIQDQAQYDALTKSISHQAQTENLEPLLKTMLKKQGINP